MIPDPTYSSSDLRKTTWGQCRELDDGTWETVWNLVIDTAPHGSVIEILTDEEEGFVATIDAREPAHAELLIKTTEHAMAAAYYPLTYSSLRIVNSTIGEISTIQGLPRDWYAPFRSS